MKINRKQAVQQYAHDLMFLNILGAVLAEKILQLFLQTTSGDWDYKGLSVTYL